MTGKSVNLTTTTSMAEVEYSHLPTIRRTLQAINDYANLRDPSAAEFAEIQRLAFVVAAQAGAEIGNIFNHDKKTYFIRPALKNNGCCGCAASGKFLTGICQKFIHRCTEEGVILVECPF